MSSFLQYTFAGIVFGSIYALIALGFTLIYRSTNIINFAQGEFVVLGGLLAVFFSEKAGFSLPVNIVLSASIVGFIAFLLDIAAIRQCKKRNANLLTLIIVTIGAAIFFRGLCMAVFWKDPGKRFPSFSSEDSINIGGAYIVPQDIWIVGITLGVLVLIILFFEFTMTGKAMKACASNKKAAQLMGINVERMTTLSFFLSGLIGALAGIVMTPKLGMSYDSGIFWGLKGFCAAIFGSIGNIYGAFVGGLLLGLIESYVLGYGDSMTFHLFQVSNYKDLIVILFMILILFIRPSGLFSGKESTRV
jgi:branched-chain amino acid transport system permease protein